MPRPLTFTQAQQRYPQRYTLDHMPQWAVYPLRRGPTGDPVCYPAPQYASDEEWFTLTTFPGEGGLSPASSWCISTRQTWPLGRELTEPYFPLDSPQPEPNPNRTPVTRDPKEVRPCPPKPATRK